MKELQHENLELFIRYLSGEDRLYDPGELADELRRIRKLKEIVRGWFTWIKNFFHHNNCVTVSGGFLYLRGGRLCVEPKFRFFDLLKHTLNRTPFLVVKMRDPENDLQRVIRSFSAGLNRIDGINSTLIFSSVWKNGEPVIVHISFTEAGRCAVKHHVIGLNCSRSAFERAGIKELIADKIYCQDADDFTVLVQRQIEGQPQRIRELKESELFAYLDACVTPLEKLYKNASESKSDSDVVFVTERISEIIDKDPQVGKLLAPILDFLRLWDQQKKFKSVLVHGDYKPGNILLDSRNEVVGIIDWEVCREYGMPGYDAMNLGVLTCAQFSGKSVFEALCEFWDRGNNRSCLTNFAETVRDRYSLSEEDIFFISVLVWLEQLSWVVSRSALNKEALADCVIGPAQQILSRLSAESFSR